MRPADPNDLAEARAEERSRIKAIITSPEAKGREQVALNLALGSDMAVEDLRATLATLPVAAEAARDKETSANFPSTTRVAEKSEDIAAGWKSAFERAASR